VTAGYVETVRVVLGDATRERTRAEQAKLQAGQPANGRDVLEQPVHERVAPGQEAQLHAIAVLHDLAQHAPHRGEAVDHDHLGVLLGGVDLLGERARRSGVALTDVGREDQYPASTVMRSLAGRC
jgi:hypothetical protein